MNSIESSSTYLSTGAISAPSNFWGEYTFPQLLERYADLLVEVGCNVQPGQVLYISAEMIHRDLVRQVVSAAYARGAKYVYTELTDPKLSRIRIEESQESYLGFVPGFERLRYEEIVDERGALLSILGAEDPDVLSGVNPERKNVVRKARFESRKRFYEQGIGCSEVQWCVASASTPQWGQKVYPAFEPEVASAYLWRDIFSVARVTGGDPVQNWRDHDKKLHARRDKLTSMQIASLHFEGKGTDLTVHLTPRSLFKGGSDESTNNHAFQANVPTEEVFTTPDCRKTSGLVTATRPFMVNGELVKGLRMEFSEGKIISWSADKGEEAFKAYLDSDEGAIRLGEVALVGIDSPVYQCGVLFHEILLDENAACHIAVGSAYRFCVEGGNEMSTEELAENGVNESSVHTDIMVSDEHTTVTAHCFDGTSVTLMEGGAWVGEFAV